MKIDGAAVGSGTGESSFSPAMREANNYIAWIISQFEPYLRGRILEVGLGHGSYFPHLQARGAYCGLDIDPDMVADARRQYPGGEFFQADLASPDFVKDLDGARFDAIVCLNVLEHIADDELACVNMVRALAPGGALCLLVPALPLLYNDLDRLAGHHRRYTVPRLRTLATAAEAEVTEAHYFNCVGGLGWLANRLVRHRSLADGAVNSQILFFDKWLVPVSRSLDQVFRGFFGQSAVAVLRRPNA